MASEQWLVIEKVIQVFDALGVPYYIGGSVASGRYGLPRMTRDVDFIAALHENQAAAFVNALQSEFYVDDLAVRRAIRSQRSFNLIHLATIWKVDIFIPADTPWASVKMERRAWHALDDTTDAPQAFLSSAEDVVLQKLFWYQKGGGLSDQQWRDVQGVLRVQDKLLDQAYLQHWAQALGLRELLSRALDEAGMAWAADAKS